MSLVKRLRRGQVQCRDNMMESVGRGQTGRLLAALGILTLPAIVSALLRSALEARKHARFAFGRVEYPFKFQAEREVRHPPLLTARNLLLH